MRDYWLALSGDGGTASRSLQWTALIGDHHRLAPSWAHQSATALIAVVTRSQEHGLLNPLEGSVEQVNASSCHILPLVTQARRVRVFRMFLPVVYSATAQGLVSPRAVTAASAHFLCLCTCTRWSLFAGHDYLCTRTGFLWRGPDPRSNGREPETRRRAYEQVGDAPGNGRPDHLYFDS